MATIAHMASPVGRIASPGGRIADRIHYYFKSSIEVWKRYRRYRSTLAELESLSLRELDDIGITPGQIHSVSHDSAFGTRK